MLNVSAYVFIFPAGEDREVVSFHIFADVEFYLKFTEEVAGQEKTSNLQFFLLGGR